MIESKSAKSFSYPTEKIGKEGRRFLPSWCDKKTWLHYGEAEDSVYSIICKNVNHYNMHNDIETPTIKTCKNYWQWFSSTRILKLSPESYPKTVKKSMEDISEMVKSNLTEVQSQNRAYLIKIISYLRYLTRKGLSLREHGNDQDSNFKQLFFLPFPCISESCIEIKIKLNVYFHTSLWCLERIYEGLHKTFWGTTKKCENKNLS